MVCYHFSFDLTLFGVLKARFNTDPFWLGFRYIIMSSFLLLVGVSAVLSERNGFKQQRFLKRLAQIAFCALLATLSSYLTFPRTFIFFGILHFNVVASLLARLFLRFRWLNLGLGLLFIGLDLTVSHPFFDRGVWQCLGLMTHKPFTEDYVPIIPWFGTVLVGMFLAQSLVAAQRLDLLKSTRGPRWLLFMGRHSLIVYMLHQPILLAVMGLIYKLSHG